MNNIKAIDSIYQSNKKELFDEGFYSKDDIKFLEESYKKTFDTISNASSEVQDKFSDQLIEIMEAIPDNDDYKANLASAILLYSNFYRIYGDKLFDVSTKNMTLAVATFETFVGSGGKDISDMDYVIDPIISHPDLIEKLRENNNKEMFVVHCIEEMARDDNKKPSRSEVQKVVDLRSKTNYSHK